MSRRLRVLVIAEAANPEWVSVPLVGWAMANALREVADVHIVTQVRNRDAILRAGLIEGRDFTAIDTERVAAPARQLAEALRGGKGKGWTLLTAVSSLTYPYFERQVWKQFGTAIKAGEYDIVHRVTPLSPTTGGPLTKRCRRAGVPFVMGPLNGGLPWPPGFDSDRRKEREWLSYVRGLYKLLPYRRATLDNASLIIAGSRHTAQEMPARVADRIVYMPENGIDPMLFGRTAAPVGDVLRLCFIGRMVPYKGADMALQAALPLLRRKRAHFDFIGDGPMLQQLIAQAHAEGVQESVNFHGWVAHRDVQTIATTSQVLVFPSVREFGGGAVLEAMALGLVPLIVDYGGPGELVAAGGGCAVPLGSREQIIAALTDALDDLVDHPARVTTLSREVRAWAHSHMTWSAKAVMVARLYDWVLTKKGDMPRFF